MIRGSLVSIFMLSFTGGAQAAETANPLSDALRAEYREIRDGVIDEAQRFKPEDYAFRPAPEARSVGEAVLHLADAQMEACKKVVGEDWKHGGPTDKASAVAAIKAAFAFCDPIYESLKDADATVTNGKKYGINTLKLPILYHGVIHNNEMEGTLSVYLRMKGLSTPWYDKKPAPKEAGK